VRVVFINFEEDFVMQTFVTMIDCPVVRLPAKGFGSRRKSASRIAAKQWGRMKFSTRANAREWAREHNLRLVAEKVGEAWILRRPRG